MTTRSATRFYLVLIGTTVLGEAVAVLLLRALPPMPPLVGALLAALVLLIALVPVLVLLRVRSGDRERAHALLLTREAQLRATLESTVDGILAVDNAGKVMHVSRRFAELWRVPPELLARGDDHELLAFVLAQLRDPAAFLAKVQALYDGDAAGFDVLQFKDGRVFERYSLPMRSEGTRIGRVWSFRDVTERDRSLLERDVLREIAHGVATSTDFQGSLQSMHRSLQRVFDAENCFVALHDARTGHFSFPYFADQRDVAPTQPVEIPRSCTAYVFRSGTPALITLDVFHRLVEADEIDLVGSQSPAWMGVPLRTPRGLIGVLALQHYEREDAYTERDLAFLASVGTQVALVIERRLAEETLRESERRLREAQDLAGLGSWELDLERGQVHLSESLCRLIGRDPARQSVSLAELPRYFTPESWTQLQASLQTAAAQGTRFELVLEVLQEGGRRRTQQGTGVAVRGPSGDVIQLRGTVFDITERRAAEQAAALYESRLQQSQRMESVGRLAGGIAHDFNNMLTIILGNVELALMERDAAQALRPNLMEVQAAARRSAELTRQLLAYAQRQSVARRELDLSQTVADQRASLQRVVGAGIRLDWHPTSDLWPVAMDPSQLAAVLANLCLNAREAGADVVTLATSNVAVGAADAPSPEAAPGDYVRLSVSDNGRGMDATTLQHAFEPFFTTKDVGQGPGLGLAEVFGAMRQSGGFVSATSAPGEGTTVDLYLPRHASVAAV
ncbi:MAG: ATP-binding protein [Gemmatimonadaceae bacterium]|jgi:signal transduction histidine kinase